MPTSVHTTHVPSKRIPDLDKQLDRGRGHDLSGLGGAKGEKQSTYLEQLSKVMQKHNDIN
jgi:hypothetical protein